MLPVPDTTVGMEYTGWAKRTSSFLCGVSRFSVLAPLPAPISRHTHTHTHPLLWAHMPLCMCVCVCTFKYAPKAKHEFSGKFGGGRQTVYYWKKRLGSVTLGAFPHDVFLTVDLSLFCLVPNSLRSSLPDDYYYSISVWVEGVGMGPEGLPGHEHCLLVRLSLPEVHLY